MNYKKKGFQKPTINEMLYHENWWWLRLLTTSLLIVAWSMWGVYTGSATNIGDVFSQAARYALAPLAALIWGFMLGAHYVQDIYELPDYSSALHYLWAAIFNGKQTNFLSGFLAFIFFALLSGGLVSSVFLHFEKNDLGRIYGVLSGLLVGGIFSFLFGKKTLPKMTISEGEKRLEKNSKTLDVIGGPGWVYVEPGNAILLERLDSPSDIFGTGRYFIPRFHRVRNIVSLKDQHASPRDLVAHSKDGIKVTVKDFQFRYRIHTGYKDRVAKRTLLAPYPFSIEAVHKMTYNRNVTVSGELAAWENVIQFGFDGAVLGFIRTNPLDKILVPEQAEGDPRKNIHDAINSAGTRNGLRNNGAELLWYDIGSFTVNKDIEEERAKVWHSKLEGNSMVVRAQGTAQLISHEERAQAEGQNAILQGIIQALEDSKLSEKVDDNMWNIVLSQSAQILETLSRMPDDNKFKEQEKKYDQKR